MKIVFFGTPAFAAESLAYLLEKGVEILGIVTKPDRPKGRSSECSPPPVKEVAMQIAAHIPIYQPEKASSAEFVQVLRKLEADLYVVVAYGQILKQNVLDLPRFGCINVHASLLPKYRGAAPIQRCLIEGEQQTGVTIMKMVLALDAGDMLRKAFVEIPQDMNYGQLEKKLAQVGKEALYETIQDYARGVPQAVAQDSSQATYAPKIELEDAELHWGRSASSLHNLVRGVNPFPGAWCVVQVKDCPKRLKIYSTQVRVLNESSGVVPGQVLAYGKQGLVIACGENALELLEVQLEGKKAMKAQDFMRGYLQEQLIFFKQGAL